MKIDKNSQEPLYSQLMKDIKEQIQNGRYKAGEKIPTDIEIVDRYQVSRITVRRAIEELCAQGVLIKRQGKGTFVEAPRIYRKIEKDNRLSFSESCRANGRKPSSHVLSCVLEKVESWQNEYLQLPEGEKLYHIERVLLADDLPIIYEHIYIPPFRVPGFQVEKLEDGSFVKLLHETYHLEESEKVRNTIEIGLVSAENADYLKMNTGEPVMVMTSYINDKDEYPLYISYEIIVGSRYRISI
ncbi:MAG: GntR family transcriptional regulator [Clostridiales bacterium]|nr:GntR family transcriptional regulator [Clostridiales bacterium]